MFMNPAALQFATAEDGDRVTVSFPADTALTEGNAEELYHALSACANGRERPSLIVDLTGVAVLTSAILSRLLTLNKLFRSAGGHLALQNPTPDVLMVFKVTKLDNVLDIQAEPA